MKINSLHEFEPEAEAHQDLETCQDLISYHFRDVRWLVCALTHSSTRTEDGASNERLEFLGDAILGMQISEELFQNYPRYAEGELTRIKSAVVSRRTLAKVARRMGLHHCVRLGRGMAERKSLPPSVLANVVEAVIGAVYLDGGYEPARTLVLRLLSDEITAVGGDQHPRNYKSLLQQFSQRRFGCAPTYRIVEQTGPDHAKVFHVITVIAGAEHCVGTGRNKKEAEQSAAEATLRRIQSESPPEPGYSQEEAAPAVHPDAEILAGIEPGRQQATDLDSGMQIEPETGAEGAG